VSEHRETQPTLRSLEDRRPSQHRKRARLSIEPVAAKALEVLFCALAQLGHSTTPDRRQRINGTRLRDFRLPDTEQTPTETEQGFAPLRHESPVDFVVKQSRQPTNINPRNPPFTTIGK
jgi:hypothetical protein